jgi:cobalt-zinc-cadmium efflux system membrane fusion protein
MLRTLLIACVVTVLALQAGCTKPAADNKVTKDSTAGEDKHDGWWCKEHGVPEGECALCSAKVAADFKKKGDWCKEHDRPESQCFICHPELEQKFAARYEAKYGSKPPPREE